MDRRNFLAGMFAAATAPAFVTASRLMRIKPIVLPSSSWSASSGPSISSPWVFDEIRIVDPLLQDELVYLVRGTGAPPPEGVITMHADMNKYLRVRYRE
jgi:hypothetical protein